MPGKDNKLYRFGNIKGSTVGWAKVIGITHGAFRSRIGKHGPESPKTFAPVDLRAQIKAIESHNKRKTKLNGIRMPPRKSVDDIPGPGEWEVNNLPQQASFGCSGRSGFVAHCDMTGFE